MRIKGGALRNKYSGLFEKFITVYDAPATKDSVYSNTTITEYIKAVMSIANEFNALVILKVKRMSALHTDLLKLYGYNRLVIDCEHGSISSAMISDAVVGLSNSTPASIAAVHGRNVITYNPSNNVWSRWESLHHPYLMVGELSDLKMALSKLLLNGKSQSTFSTISIDPYGDGKAQYRIARYMQDIFKHLSFGKKFSLHHADNEYRRLWGNDKVLTRL